MTGEFCQERMYLFFLSRKDVKEEQNAVCRPQAASSLIRVVAPTSTSTSPTAVFLQGIF